MNAVPSNASPRGLTIGGITALLAMIASYTGAIDYVRAAAAEYILWPQLRAVLVGMTIGVAFSAWVPYVFARHFDADRARMWMRLGSSVLTFAVAWRMQQTELGFYYALIAGLAGAQIYLALAGLVYKLFPAIEPKALQE